MTLISDAAANIDQADLIVLANVETIRDQEQPATPSAVAALIGGAPALEVGKRMMKMWRLGLVEDEHSAYLSCQLTELGAELLRQELVGWSPSAREEQRRQDEMRARINEVMTSPRK